jgi:hypothetical protein
VNKVTTEMVDEFNNFLEEKGSIIRLFHSYSSVDIKTVIDTYLPMEDQIINPTKEFYADLEHFFSNNGLKITYNNMWSCFWSH